MEAILPSHLGLSALPSLHLYSKIRPSKPIAGQSFSFCNAHCSSVGSSVANRAGRLESAGTVLRNTLHRCWPCKKIRRSRTRKAYDSCVSCSARASDIPGKVVTDGQEEQAATARVDQDGSYDWTQQWYPVHYSRDFPSDIPVAVSIFDKPFVLYRDGEGKMRALRDQCPHRAAALSEGQIFNGRLECLYHGWQFDGATGACTTMPQLPKESSIPRSCGVQTYPVEEHGGIIWLWPSDPDPFSSPSVGLRGMDARADPSTIFTFPAFTDSKFRWGHFLNDVPYDHSILIENLLDPAHLSISHDGTKGGGRREDAKPLNMVILESIHNGFTGELRRASKKASVSQNKAGAATGEGKTSMETTMESFRTLKYNFHAPCIIHVQTQFEIPLPFGIQGVKGEFHGFFCCTPLGKGRARFLFTTGTNSGFISPSMRWLEHFNSNRVIEEDMGLLATQEVFIRTAIAESTAPESSKKHTSHVQSLSQLYFALKSSDLFLMEYRKWLDKVGHGMPYYEGYRTWSTIQAGSERTPVSMPQLQSITGVAPMPHGVPGTVHAVDLSNRYLRHTVHCSSCMAAMRTWKVVRASSFTFATLVTMLGLLASPDDFTMRSWLALAMGAFVLLGYVSHLFVERFRTNYVRKHRR